MSKLSLTAVLIALVSTTGYADNCEPMRAQIESKIKTSGVMNFTLAIFDIDASVAGKVVGSCGNSTKKIIYLQGNAPTGPAPAAGKAKLPAKAKQDAILTECKDGTVSMGGACRK